MELELNGRRRDALYANVLCVGSSSACVLKRSNAWGIFRFHWSSKRNLLLHLRAMIYFFKNRKEREVEPRKNFRCGRTEISPFKKGKRIEKRWSKQNGLLVRWWWNQLKKVLILTCSFIFMFSFFFSFSTPLLESDRVLALPSPWRTRTGHWSTWLLSRANYYHGMQSVATPSASFHLLPLLFFLLVTFVHIYGVISCIVGGISSSSSTLSFCPWYPFE